MDNRRPRIELGKSIYNENENVAFLYGFDSIERCDYYKPDELDSIIKCIENAKNEIKNQDTGQMNFDWRVKESYGSKEKENNKVNDRLMGE